MSLRAFSAISVVKVTLWFKYNFKCVKKLKSANSIGKFDLWLQLELKLTTKGICQYLKALLNRMSLQFEVEKEEDWGGLPENAIEGIKAGLQDLAAARVHSHEFVMAAMKKKITDFRNKNTC